MELKVKLLTALDKVFLDAEPMERPEYSSLSGFRGEVMSFQVAYTVKDAATDFVRIEVESPISQWVRVRHVQHVPVRFAAYSESTDNYLRTTPGLYPDLLRDIKPHAVRTFRDQWDTLWIDIEPDAATPAGVYDVTVSLMAEDGSGKVSRTAKVEVIDAFLPEQKLIHTKWFHADGILHYYHTEAFSEEFWRIVEKQIKSMVRGGINMILTPVHTPPLDTRVGGERNAVQLVDVTLKGGEYSFGFDKLRRWVDVCERAGIRYYEIAHLYTQWGARFTPKIMADVDGVKKCIFGWDVSATSPEYKSFLAAYIPALIGEFKALGIDDRCYFHISDEPNAEQIDDYLAAKAQVADLLKGYPIMDALSDITFYESGAVEHPIPASNHISPFLAAKVPGLWTYYCIAQYEDVSNQFISMPSARNRILGVQLYKYEIEGFLQWGFNFYNTQYSDYAVDPYFSTDANGFSPAGDPFQVYPGPDGEPEDSIRKMVTAHAIYDMRAFDLLERLAGRGFVMQLIQENAGCDITFSRYPTGDAYLLDLRRRVNEEIKARL